MINAYTLVHLEQENARLKLRKALAQKFPRGFSQRPLESNSRRLEMRIWSSLSLEEQRQITRSLGKKWPA